MTNDEARLLLEPMDPETKIAIARAVRDSAADAAGGRPASEDGFIADVYDAAERVIQGRPVAEDSDMVLDAYLEVVLADCETAEEILDGHRKVVDAYTA
jgi:hypothetical protein